jgi:hypothetical protein
MNKVAPSGRLRDGRHTEKFVTFSSHMKRFETEIEEMNSGGEEKIEKGGFMSKTFQRRASLQILLPIPTPPWR